MRNYLLNNLKVQIEVMKEIKNIRTAKEKWETYISIQSKYYDVTIGVLYIDNLFFGAGNFLIIQTVDKRALKFLVTDDTKLKIFRVNNNEDKN